MDNHILVIYGKHKRKCPKLQRMSRSVRNSKKRPFHEFLPSYQPWVLLCFVRTRCLRVRRVITELFVLQNRGCKVNEMPFKHPAFLRSHGLWGGGLGGGSYNDGVMWLRFKDETQAVASAAESERFHARWMYVCGGPSQKSHTSCQTRPRTMEQHYAGMYRLVPSGFLASDREPVRRRRLRPLSDFLGLSLRAVPDVCGRYPSGVMAHMKIQWLHTHTLTHSHTGRYGGSARCRDESLLSDCRCCIVLPK